MKIPEKILEICELLDEKKAEEIVVCDLTAQKNVVDFFIVANGTSSTHIKSIADFVEEKAKENGFVDEVFREGYNLSSWIVLDLEDTFVHVFTKEARELFMLEKFLNEGNNVYSYKKLLSMKEKQTKTLSKEQDKKRQTTKKTKQNDKKK